ncbi:MAG: hypothetical protein J0H55_14760 [Chitinophagaceae bacterium]|nr:hypothetical protein [Chitinophagaceae bacterium]
MEPIRNKMEEWRRLLGERMEENLLLKNKLANILTNNYDQNLLEKIEDFQSRLICEDELIYSLRQVINELENLIKNNWLEDEKFSKMIHLRDVWLQKDMAYSSVRFCDLKSGFNEFQEKISGRGGDQKI